jgi:hypothetical protein
MTLRPKFLSVVKIAFFSASILARLSSLIRSSATCPPPSLARIRLALPSALISISTPIL